MVVNFYSNHIGMGDASSPVMQVNQNKGPESHVVTEQNVYDGRNWQENSSSSSRSSPDHPEFPAAQQQAAHQLQSVSKVLSSTSPESSRDPADVLLKIFPYLDPVVLGSVLKNCQGDLLKAVEILSPHSMTRLREVKPNSVDHLDVPPASFARHLSAFSMPNRGIDQPPCTCCHRSGTRKYIEFMPTNRMEMLKYNQMMHRIADHDARNQECRSHINYFMSFQDASSKFMNEIPARRHSDSAERMNIRESFCLECKAPARPQDLFCRACGARISKTVH